MTTTIRRCALLFAILAAPSPALAAEWSRSFPPKSVASYLDHGGMRILVAAAGKKRDIEAADDAADALREALRRSGRTRMVMDDESLGNVALLDDKHIVARCSSLPVDAVAVVRVFPGAADAADAAVVTLFDKEGGTLGAFTAESGTPLAPRGRSEGVAAGQGVSNEAAGAVSKILHQEKRSPPSAARAEYEKKFVGFLDITGVNQYGAVVGRWTQPYQGKYQRSLDVPQFYDAVGAHDQADEWRKKSRIKTAIGVPAAILTVGGALTAIMAGTFLLIYSTDTCDASYQDCNAAADKKNSAGIATGVGAGALVAGIALLIANGAVSRPTVTPDEAKEMADHHNQRLRARLGLPTDEESAEAPRQEKTAARSLASSLRVQPSLSARGGGLALALSF